MIIVVNDVQKQNKKVTIFAILLSIVSIGLLVFGFSLVSSDKVVLLQSISNLYGRVEDSFENNSELLDKIATSKNIGIRSNIGFNYDSSSVGLSLNYLENKDSKKSKLDLDVTMNNEKLIGGDVALADNNVYFSVDDITPNYYYTAFEYMSFISGLESNDYDKILDTLKESVTDNISDDNLKKEKVTISYNGKDKKVNKITYEITNKALKNVVTSFVDSLKKDKKLLENIASYLDMETDEIIKSLDNFLEEIKVEEEKVLCNYVVYYYGFNKIIGYELVELESNAVLEYKVQDKESIILSQEDVQILVLNIQNNKKDYTFDGFITSEESEVKFYGSLSGNNLIFSVVSEGTEFKANITSSNIEKDNSFITTTNIILSTIVDGTETELGKLDLSTEYYFGEEVSINLNNSVDINNITEEETQVIYNNLMNHPIYQIVSSLMTGLEQM